jgi:hypothetical protein
LVARQPRDSRFGILRNTKGAESAFLFAAFSPL